MKLQGDTAATAKDSNKILFFRKSRVSPEQNAGIFSGRHLECEEGLCDKGIISKILYKFSALGRGEATLFGSKTYSPHKRSKSHERLSSALPISPFVPRSNLPASKASTIGSSTQLHVKPNPQERKRLSQPNIFTRTDAQLKVATGGKTSNNRGSVDFSLDVENAKRDKQNSSVTCSPKANENVTKISVISEKVPPVKTENESSCNVKKTSEVIYEKDLKKKGPPSQSEVAPVVEAPKSGVTKIHVKYYGPLSTELNESQSVESYTKNDNGIIDSSNSKKTDPPKKNDVTSNESLVGYQSFILTSQPRAYVAALTPAEPTPVTAKATTLSEPQIAWSTWNHSTAKKQAKTPPGKLTIRPASNLTASKLKTEFLKLTEFTDIKTGEFTAPAKPTIRRKIEKKDEEEEEPISPNVEETKSSEREERNKREAGGGGEDEDKDDYEFIGAGVIQGKSMLSKTKQNKRRSVIFNESPVIHVIDSIRYEEEEEEEEIPFEADGGSTTNLLSSLTGASSTGGLSTYKSKTLVDFEFDFDSPPLAVRLSQGLGTCSEEASSSFSSSSAAAAPDNNLLWSSNSTLDLLF